MGDELVPPVLEDDGDLSEFARTPDGDALPVTYDNYELLSVPEQRRLVRRLEESVRFLELSSKKMALESHNEAVASLRAAHDSLDADLAKCVLSMARGAAGAFAKDEADPDSMGNCSHRKSFVRAMNAVEKYTKWKKDVLFTPKAPLHGKVEVNVQQNNAGGDYEGMFKGLRDGVVRDVDATVERDEGDGEASE